MSKQHSRRRSNFLDPERGRRDFVEQRLEEVEIDAVDERDVNRRGTQRPRSGQATEARAYDQNMRTGRRPGIQSVPAGSVKFRRPSTQYGV